MFLLVHQIIVPFHHWMKAAPLGLRVASDFLLHFCCVSFLRGWGVRASFGNPVAVATEIDGHFRPSPKGPDRIVIRKFGAVAKVLWPFKTAAHIAAIAKTDERTARRWLAGEFEPPGIVIATIILEITRRD